VLLFLDFDGVLRHRETAPYRLEPDRLNAFEDAVRLIPEAEIVITSTWREVMPLAKLRGLFAEDLQARIIGVTPFAWAQDGHYRHREVLAFLKRHGLLERPWIGIGDDWAHYPAGCELLLIDPSRGFDREAGRRLVLAARRLLASNPA
jgi:HAD domain in Swiss Army Knife RNA repair proteins